jgi:hypothetical protein
VIHPVITDELDRNRARNRLGTGQIRAKRFAKYPGKNLPN